MLQPGARLHYAVPAVYARADALYRLYTDACASVGILALARRILPTRFRSPALRRLLGRTLPPELAPELVRVETLSTIAERVRLHLARKPDALVSTDARIRRRVLRDGFGDANCVYCVSNADLDVMKAARDAGLTVVYEQIICPSVGRILREERRLFPNIEAEDTEDEIEGGIARDISIFNFADAVICASAFVQQDVHSLAGPNPRTTLVPYGINPEWRQVPRTPIPGRVLFVGTVGLRKGSHYLAEATRLLKGRGIQCDVRVVGPYDPDVISRPEFRGPTYVGQVPRELVRAEFAQADVFAFPTLAEGFALVHVEAFSCGLPVVTTPNCGSQVRHGEDGFVVPIRDARALADRLEQVISDRALRERLSRAASEHAAELSWARFGELMIAATQDAMLTSSGRDRTRAGRSPC